MANITDFLETLDGIAFKEMPAPQIPSPLPMGAQMRCGITVAGTEARVMQMLSENNFNIKPKLDSGEANKLNLLVHIIVKAIVDEIHDNAKVTCTSAPGSVMITAEGGNAGGPIVVEGVSVNFPDTIGVIQ